MQFLQTTLSYFVENRFHLKTNCSIFLYLIYFAKTKTTKRPRLTTTSLTSEAARELAAGIAEARAKQLAAEKAQKAEASEADGWVGWWGLVMWVLSGLGEDWGDLFVFSGLVGNCWWYVGFSMVIFLKFLVGFWDVLGAWLLRWVEWFG